MCICKEINSSEHKACAKCASETEVEEREIQIVCPSTNKINRQNVILCDKCFCEYIDEEKS